MEPKPQGSQSGHGESLRPCRNGAADPCGVPRVNVLGVGIVASTMKEVVGRLVSARRAGRQGYVCVTSVHGVIESQRDPELRRIHNRSFMTVPDGMPNVWMGREYGFIHMERIYGPDLMLALCAATNDPIGFNDHDSCAGEGGNRGSDVLPGHLKPKTADASRPLTHFLYGSTPETLAKLKANLERKFPGILIAGTFAPPFRPLNEEEELELHRVVSTCKPDFFWVGLSTPKQERFMASHSPAANRGFKGHDSSVMQSGDNGADLKPKHPTPKTSAPRHLLEAGIMLGVGAAFDIHAGLLKDAPGWIKSSGLQWFYRLCQEPRRLWRRYLDIVPRFILLAALQLLGINKYSLDGAAEPYGQP